MDWFYISPFTINVLSVAILIIFIIFYLLKTGRKKVMTRHLIIFLSGVEIVFFAFIIIFSSLNHRITLAAWWGLHIVIFSSASMLQFAYHFPENIHENESRKIFVITIAAAIIFYPIYLFHTTLIEQVYNFDGRLFVVLGTPEVGIVIGLELFLMLFLFLRKSLHFAGVDIRKSGITGSLKEIFRTDDPRAKATRNLFIIFISPVVLVIAIIMAYTGMISFDIVGHLFGTVLMVAVFFFVVQYINYSSEPSTFMVKLVGISLGTLLIFLGFLANAALIMKDSSFENEALLKLNISRDIVSGLKIELPEGVKYIAQASIKNEKPSNYRIIRKSPDFKWDTEFRTTEKWKEKTRYYRKFSEFDPDSFYLHYDFKHNDKIYEVGFSYRNYRQTIHETAIILVIALFVSVFFVVSVFPFFFRESLLKPLKHLLDGVEKVNNGNLDIVVPVKVNDEIGYLSFSFNRMVRSVLESEMKLKGSLDHQVRLTDAYTRFVPREFLDFLDKETIIEISLGDYVKTMMTIVFSDIREFTNLSEKMTPHENFRFINSYLKVVGPVVRKYNGFIDKYIGDAVMALFPKSPSDAIKASIEMQETIKTYNKERVNKNLDPIRFGVGIHTGEMMLGTIGEEKRMEGTVISDAVNLASRMERLTKLYGVSLIVSDSTLDNEGKNLFDLRYLDRVKVKGKSRWVDIFEVFDCDEPEIRDLKKETLKDFAKGVENYQKKEIEKALTFFTSVYEKNSKDNPARLYIERCEHYLKYGIPDEFSGVTELGEKKF